jgi:hypothetical protein
MFFAAGAETRRGPQNLALHGDHAALPANLKNAIVNTIQFCLEDGPNTDQEAERLHNKDLYKDLEPPLCVLDIPSARGVGMVADMEKIWMSADYGTCADMMHLHMASSAALPDSITDARTALQNAIDAQEKSLGIEYPKTCYEKASDREKYRKCNKAVMAQFHTLITNATNDATNPFHVYHTYELACPGKYLRGQEEDTMKFGDPLRNVRKKAGANTTLFKPPNVDNASSWMEMPNTFSIDQVQFFVDRNGKVRLTPLLDVPTMALMVEDALGQLE